MNHAKTPHLDGPFLFRALRGFGRGAGVDLAKSAVPVAGDALTAADALRWLAHEAKDLRGRDALEMHALLYPAVLKQCGLEPMPDHEAAAFKERFRQLLRDGASR